MEIASLNTQEFCDKWGIKRSELALLLDVPQQTVRHWASNTDRSEPANILQMLDHWDLVFELMRIAQTRAPTAIAIFSILSERKKGTIWKSDLKILQ
jgi:hypothetical protein